MKRLLRKLKCFLFGHKWTNNTRRPITRRQYKLLEEGKWEQVFHEQMRKYCKRCGHKPEERRKMEQLKIEDHELDTFS